MLSKSLLCGLHHVVVAAVNKAQINPRVSQARVFRPDAAESVCGSRLRGATRCVFVIRAGPSHQRASNYPKQRKTRSLGKIFAFIQNFYSIDLQRFDWLTERGDFLPGVCHIFVFLVIGQAEALNVIVSPCAMGNLKLNSIQCIIDQ